MTYQISARDRFIQAHDICLVSVDCLPHGYPLHFHDFVEIVIILDGQAEHRLDDRGRSVSRGEVFVVQGSTSHGFFRATPDFRQCNVMFNPEAAGFPLERLRPLPGYQALFVLEPSSRRDGECRSRLQLTPPQVGEVMTLAQRLQQEQETRTAGFDVACQALLLELVIFLVRRYAEGTTPATTGMLRLGAATAWMEQNFQHPASLADLARQAAMSPRHFQRVFRQAFGLPPLEYLNRLRVRYGARLLAAGSHNVSEAALAAGFTDSNYFSRRFHQLHGVPPRQFRKERFRGYCIQGNYSNTTIS